MILDKIKYKNKVLWLALALAISTLSGCFKDFKEDFLFTDFMVEFDATTWQSSAPGKNYPILGPLEKGSGVYTIKVNLIGGQKATDQLLQYRVVASETTAEEGTHFALHDNGQFVVAANSSTGEIAIEILDFPAESGLDTLVLELVGSDEVKVSENYKRLGVSISLVGPPSEGHALHTQIGPESYFNSIYIDPLNPYLPQDIRQRLEQSEANLAAVSGGPRLLQNMYIYFGADNLVSVVAQYYGGGGNAIATGPVAIWNYNMVLDANGVGRLEFASANGNGNAQRANFAPILGNYLEQYEFRVDWVDAGIATPTRPEKQLGGLFRTDDANSYVFGTLESLNAAGTLRPFPSSPAVHDLFTDGAGGYFNTLYIDPDDLSQSEAFRTRWAEGKAHIEGIAGRQLHKMMFYFNPAFNFQDIRLATYYYSATGGRFLGQMRFRFRVDYEGNVKPFEYLFNDANGGAVRSPQLIDNFLMVTEFAMSKEGNRVRFTSKTDPNVYFYGELGNLPLGVNEYWPE